jgi:hypothetical protein
MQSAIRKVIDFLTRFNKSLERAYYATYADTGTENDITKEFYIDLRRRRAMNKGRVVVELGKCAAQDILKKDNYLIGFEQAIIIGERLFNEALKQGDIDELYNLKQKENKNDKQV